jgi:hypothetical protein
MPSVTVPVDKFKIMSKSKNMYLEVKGNVLNTCDDFTTMCTPNGYWQMVRTEVAGRDDEVSFKSVTNPSLYLSALLDNDNIPYIGLRPQNQGEQIWRMSTRKSTEVK